MYTLLKASSPSSDTVVLFKAWNTAKIRFERQERGPRGSHVSADVLAYVAACLFWYGGHPLIKGFPPGPHLIRA